MAEFWKASAIIMLTIVLGVTLGKTEKDFAVVLSILACCAVMVIAIGYLESVMGFLWKLGSSFRWENPFLESLLKISGVALVTELVGLISSDAGNQSLGKAMQILGDCVILFLSLPMFEGFFATIRDMMGFI